MNLYNRLQHTTTESGGAYQWLGNLRWYVTEQEKESFSFRCITALESMTHQDRRAVNMTKELLRFAMRHPKSTQWVYGADYIKTSHFSVYLPFFEYGGLIWVDNDFEIGYEGECSRKDSVVIIHNGEYFICLHLENPCDIQENKITVNVAEAQWVAVSFHIDEERAIKDCERLYVEKESVLSDNQKFWNDYLESCPTINLENDYVYQHKSMQIEEHYTTDDFVTRQLWHYWCLLMNVSEVEFNVFPLYMAPDKINWLGSWSNDACQSMAALSLTNQKDYAKRLLISYIKNAMTVDGVFSWYMHADGVGCYGVRGDVGRFSHGDPYLPQAVEYYIRNTGDDTILSADAGGVTVYDKLKTYMLNLHKLRDINHDSLIEWSNLWETGWDDKGGTFFTSASLEEWMDVVSQGSEEEIAKFYEQHQRPVMAIVEQVIGLWSYGAMAKLAALKQDTQLEVYCNEMYDRMIETVTEKCWNERDGFYYDIDVKSNTQTTEKSADAFYWMNFEKNAERNKRLLEHLNNEKEFNCYYVPMLSKDSAGFNQFGYWSGGHWPREMSIIAMGLHRAGFDEKAMELLVRAIMSDEGSVIAEVIEPLEGKRSTAITKVACAVMNVVALLDVAGEVKWFCKE